MFSEDGKSPDSQSIATSLTDALSCIKAATDSSLVTASFTIIILKISRAVVIPTSVLLLFQLAGHQSSKLPLTFDEYYHCHR